MTRRSLWISLCVLCLSSCPVWGAAQDVAEPEQHEYRLMWHARGRDVTGICLINIEAGGDMVGTVVNEFGVRLFDFSHTAGETRVSNFLAPIDRWYIRRVVRADMALWLSHFGTATHVVRGRRHLDVSPGGDVVLANKRFKLTYNFKKITKDDDTD